MWGHIKSRYGLKVAVFYLLGLTLSACFHETNHPPTANAGANVVASILSTITLDGSQSSDVDGDGLSYQWEITEKPETSNVALSDPKAVKPSLVLDAIGQYVVKLIVSDGKKQSKADFVTITTFNDRPVAVIAELSVRNGSHYVLGDTISLDGSGSHDPENQDLFYNWDMSVKPKESNVVLSNNTAINPSFTVDVPGHYIVHLIVNDGMNLSEPQMMIFEIEAPIRKTNTRPFAEAGPDQALFEANSLILLDGSQSYDVENDELSYQWEMIYKPQDSSAQLISSTTVNPQFTADVLGSYVMQLIVIDRDGASHLDSIIVTPHDSPGLACGDCHDNINTVGKPQSHQLTFDDCFQCHFLDTWVPSKGNFHAHGHTARPAQCFICHDGEDATGKSTDHVLTDKDCNNCHQLSNGTWVPAYSKPTEPSFNHKGIYSNCTACHDNQFKKGKPQGHMPVSDRCLACHTTEYWPSELHLEHTQIFGLCSDCHNGSKAAGKPAMHISTQENCSQCHKKTTWLSAKKP